MLRANLDYSPMGSIGNTKFDFISVYYEKNYFQFSQNINELTIRTKLSWIILK
jgi:hypothetical protein